MWLIKRRAKNIIYQKESEIAINRNRQKSFIINQLIANIQLMNSHSLRDLLLGLRNMITSDAEINRILYFIDHIYQLTPKLCLDIHHARQAQLQTQLKEAKDKLKAAQKLIKSLEEDKRLMQLELDCRDKKIQNLQKKFTEIKQLQLKRQRIERKKKEMLDKQVLSQTTLSNVWNGHKEMKLQTDTTLDEQGIKQQLHNELLEISSDFSLKGKFSDTCSEDSFQLENCRFRNWAEIDQTRNPADSRQTESIWLLTKSSQQYQILKSQ